VTLTAATKTFSFAGLRLAVAVFGSPALLERYQSIPRFLLGGASGPGAAASIAGWTAGDAWVDALVDYLLANRDHVGRFVAERLPGVRLAEPESTYLAWLDCRELVAAGRCSSPAEFFLEEARVALNDGADFGEHGVGFARLNFATSRALLDEVLERMAAALA
jgi:cysteine-S-conjugate beta-lyase